MGEWNISPESATSNIEPATAHALALDEIDRRVKQSIIHWYYFKYTHSSIVVSF